MEGTNEITDEEIMACNYRGLQLLAKRVGIRANTRQDVLRRSLLRVSFQSRSVPVSEVFEEESPQSRLQVHTAACVTIAALFCLYWFPNCSTFFSWGLVAIMAYCGFTASVLASIFCCEWTAFVLPIDAKCVHAHFICMLVTTLLHCE